MKRMFNEVFGVPQSFAVFIKTAGDGPLTARAVEQVSRAEAKRRTEAELGEGDRIASIHSISSLANVGADVAVAFEGEPESVLECMLEARRLEKIADIAEETRSEYQGIQNPAYSTIDSGPFRLTGEIESQIGGGTVWHRNEVADAEMIAELVERVQMGGLIGAPTAQGEQVDFAVQVLKGTGHYAGHDTCLIRLYGSAWACLASDVMPVEEEFFERAIEIAGTDNDCELAKAIVGLCLEYAWLIYQKLTPFLTEGEREAIDEPVSAVGASHESQTR